MNWSEAYEAIDKPAIEDIQMFIQTPLFSELCSYLEHTFNVKPSLEYSKCSLQKGWNIKYKKSSKSLCTIYPMSGYFIVLLTLGVKEDELAQAVIPTCNQSLQERYQQIKFSGNSKWLMIEIRTAAELNYLLKLIHLKITAKKPH